VKSVELEYKRLC